MDSRQKESKKASIPEPTYIDDLRIDHLKETELFKDVEEEALNSIALTGRICRLGARKRLYTTRHDVDYIYVIRNGYVSIWRPSCFDGKKHVFLAWRGPHQILGELREVGTEPSDTTIKTCDVCDFIEIRLDSFLDLAISNRFLYRNILNLVLKKIAYEGHRSEVIQMKYVKNQVAQTLIHLAQDRCESSALKGPVVRVPGSIYQSELAAYAGIKTRESANGELNDLRNKKIIAYDRKKSSPITILQLNELEKIVRAVPATSRRKKTAKNPKKK